jgi:hypothetical protein
MQDDNFANGRGQQDQHGQKDRQRILRAQQEAREREQLEQDEDDERARHREPGARPGAVHAVHAVHADQAVASPSRAAAVAGTQKGGRGRVLLLGAAVVAALAFAGYKYTRSPGTQVAAAPGNESPLTAGLPPVSEEPPRTSPPGPALPSAAAEAAQPVPAATRPAQAEAGNLLGQVPPSPQTQSTAATEPATARSGAGPAPAAPGAGQALQERVQTVETLVQELRDQLAGLEGQQAELAAKAATPRPPSRRRPVSRPVAAAPAAPEPAAPKLAGRLLAVDTWGGVPSVIIGTGLPGDKRTRVLRPGDTYNGISLVEANRARGEATFMADGKQFRLTLQDAE